MERVDKKVEMTWIDAQILPNEEGKYTVKTERPHYYLKGKTIEQVIESNLIISRDNKGKVVKTWNCSNQKVVAWLKEN